MKMLVALALLLVTSASPEIRYFRYERPVPPPPRAGQSCLALDAGIYAHAAPQLSDLRLYRDGTESAYAINMSAPEDTAEKSIAPLNKGRSGAQTVLDAALPEGRYSDLQLAVAARDFIATVTVTGSQSQDAKPGTTLGSFTIFDLTRQKLGRSTVLHLPDSDFRYLHFRIAGPLTAENITGLSIERRPTEQPHFVAVEESAHIVQKGKVSVLEFTVPAHVPVDRFAITPAAAPALFSRDVTLSVAPAAPAENSSSPLTASGSLLRLHTVQNGHRIDEERLALDAPRAEFDTPSKWTVTIDNGDDAPLALQSARLDMLERVLCFDAVAGAHYTLYYGDPALAAPRYDYATLFALEANAPRLSAGPEQVNAAWQQRPDTRPFTEKYPALLWIALIAVVALLAFIALGSAKRAAP